jgi:hypothetical protein
MEFKVKRKDPMEKRLVASFIDSLKHLEEERLALSIVLESVKHLLPDLDQRMALANDKAHEVMDRKYHSLEKLLEKDSSTLPDQEALRRILQSWPISQV